MRQPQRPVVRLRRMLVAGGVTLTLALLAAGPAAAQTGASGSDRTGQGAAATQVVPLSADLEITRTAVDAVGQSQTDHETRRVYRDSQGRMRTEAGSSVTIIDPVANTTVLLDSEAGTFQRISRDPSPAPSSPAGPAISRNKQLTSTPRSLGVAMMQGVRAQGTEYAISIPAQGIIPQRHKELEVWISTELQLQLLTRVVESADEEYTEAYTNIQTGQEPAAELFQVPASYREADPAAAGLARPGAGGAQPNQATCPLQNDDPVIMVSIDLIFLDARAVNAVTDPSVGCIFVDGAAIFQYPLDGFPNTNLFLPFFQWIVFDNGGLLPFLPYVAAGDIAFAVSNGGDVTIKDSLITLTVLPA